MAAGDYTGESFPYGDMGTFVYGLTWDGEGFWIVNNSTGTAHKFVDGVDTGVSVSIEGAARVFVWDGEYFWGGGTSSTTVSQFTSVGTKTGFLFDFGAVFDDLRSACFDGTYLWLVSGTGKTAYKFTTSGEYTGVSFATDIVSPRGLTWDGESFWIINNTNNSVVQYSAAGVATGVSFSIAEQSPSYSYGMGSMVPDSSDIFLVSDTGYVYRYEGYATLFYFDGDFTTVTQSNYDTYIAPKLILDAGAIATLNEGVGLEITGIGSVYTNYYANEFNTGDVVVIKDDAGNTLFEHTVTTAKAYAVNSNGFTYLFDENRNSLIDGIAGNAYLKVSAGDTLTHVYTHSNDYSEEIISLSVHFVSANIIFANPNMTPAEAIAGLPVTPVCSAENFVKLSKIKMFDKKSLFMANGEPWPTGYYQSTVTISGVPVEGMKVFCYDNYGALLDITYSDENGIYRFDEMLMGRKYMFVAQHDDGDPTTPPEYLATASDWQSPTAY